MTISVKTSGKNGLNNYLVTTSNILKIFIDGWCNSTRGTTFSQIFFKVLLSHHEISPMCQTNCMLQMGSLNTKCSGDFLGNLGDFTGIILPIP